MENERLLARFESVEKQLELDKTTYAGVHWWDLFRYQTHNVYSSRSIDVDKTTPAVSAILVSIIRSLAGTASLIFKKPALILFASHKRLNVGPNAVDPFTYFLQRDLDSAGVSSAIVHRPGRSLNAAPAGSWSLTLISIFVQSIALLRASVQRSDSESWRKKSIALILFWESPF